MHVKLKRKLKMKFDALFEMKAPEFFKEAELNKTFIRQIEEIGEDHYDYVIESIISVNTNNAINQKKNGMA